MLLCHLARWQPTAHHQALEATVLAVFKKTWSGDVWGTFQMSVSVATTFVCVYINILMHVQCAKKCIMQCKS